MADIRVGNLNSTKNSDVQILVGTKPTPVGGLVSADQSTVVGDGSSAHPLSVEAGSIAIVTDDTLQGDGTTGSPLGTVPDKTPVAVDGATIVGNGTLSSPLAAVGGSTGAGNSDGVTLQGTGLLVNPYAIKAVQHDGTLAGNGAVGNALTVSPAGNAGKIAIATSGAELAGNGQTATPLHVVPSALDGEVAVAVDGTTVQGDGLTATPLHVPGGSVSVVTGASLSGNGTTGSPLVTVADKTAVLTDGTTIAGDGTTGNALHVLNGAVVKPFTYTVVGTEPDLANLIVPLPAAQPDTGYYVTPWQGDAAHFLAMRTPSAGKTTTQFVLALSAVATAGDVFLFTVVHP